MLNEEDSAGSCGVSKRCNTPAAIFSLSEILFSETGRSPLAAKVRARRVEADSSAFSTTAGSSNARHALPATTSPRLASPLMRVMPWHGSAAAPDGQLRAAQSGAQIGAIRRAIIAIRATAMARFDLPGLESPFFIRVLLRYAAGSAPSTWILRRFPFYSSALRPNLVAVFVQFLVHLNFSGERAVHVSEIARGEDHADHPPREANFQSVCAGLCTLDG